MKSYTRLKLACYSAGASMSVAATLSPLLFLTFRALYGLTYTQMGLLILLNFSTQLAVDLVFSFFSHRFDIQKTVRISPLLMASGLLVYSVIPVVSPKNALFGLIAGTLLFSISAGLSEVLMSPVFAAIPLPDPDRQMSKLHSVYAWGVIFVVLVCTVFLHLFGTENWYYLVWFFVAVPLVSAFLFFTSTIPDIQNSKNLSGVRKLLKAPVLILFVTAIFLGGAAECTMSQWASGFLEQAVKLPKLWGDLLGVAMFAVMLGAGRTLYAKKGKNLANTLFLGAIGAFLCYVAAAISPIPAVSVFACAMTGLCTSMMWPGSLVAASEMIPDGGVFLYALMAAGGDFGASFVPQAVGLITDGVSKSELGINLSARLLLSPEQLGMKIALLFGSLFPLAAILVFFKIKKLSRLQKKEEKA